MKCSAHDPIKRRAGLRPHASALLVATLALISNPTAALAQCGGEGQDPCICYAGGIIPYPCCNGGFGQDPPILGPCRSCWLGSSPFNCTFDGRGQEGEPGWIPGSAESLRTNRFCDTGLWVNPSTGRCENGVFPFRRHKDDVAAFVGSWGWQRLRLQYKLEGGMPLTQATTLKAHNAFNNAADGYPFFQHSYSMSDMLDMGVRFVNLDALYAPDRDIYGELRLAHGSYIYEELWEGTFLEIDDLGFSAADRPYRHGVEELARWIRDPRNADQIVIISIQNDSDHNNDLVVTPLEQLLGDLSGDDIIFRPSDLEAVAGPPPSPDAIADTRWSTITRDWLLARGFRVIIDSYLDNPQDIAIPIGTLPSDCGDNCGGVTQFMASYQYPTGNPMHWNLFDGFGGDCGDPGNDYGQTNPTNVAAMVKAGVDFIGLEPIGSANAATYFGQPPYFQDFQPLIEAAIWSWAPNEPSGSGAALVRRSTGRMHSASPGISRRYATLGPAGRCWSFSSSSVSFAQAQQDADFVAPGNGLQMARLIDAMAAAGIDEVWVNYSDLDADSRWTSVVRSEAAGQGCSGATAYVDPNGDDFNSGFDPAQPVRTIQHAVEVAGYAGTVILAPGTYNENLQLGPTTPNRISIQGSTQGASIITGTFNGRVVTVAGPGADVALSDLTIRDGKVNANEPDYRGSGVAAFGSSSRLTLNRCTVVNNVVPDLGFGGGGGYSEGHTNLINCTISGNYSSTSGAGWRIAALPQHQSRVLNCTITDNHTLACCEYGGGLSTSAFTSPVILGGNIIADNTAGQTIFARSDDMDITGFVSIGYNLVEQTQAADFILTDILGVDPDLDPLADNGGPTQTHLPRPGSRALDAADPARYPATDQRGAPRPTRSECAAENRADIGAVELQSISSPRTLYVSACGDDSWTGTTNVCQAPNGPKATIQAAIDVGCDNDHAETILVGPGFYNGLVDFRGRRISLIGTQGAQYTHLNGQESGTTVAMTHAEPGGTSIHGFTISSGRAEIGGGMHVAAGARVRVSQCTFEENLATRYGGAIACTDPNSLVDVSNCIFMGNFARGTNSEGGAIFGQQGYVIVSSSLFYGNSATFGGAIRQFPGGGLEVYNCTIVDNIAEGNVGGVLSLAPAHIINSIVRDNSHGDVAFQNASSFAWNSNIGGAGVFPGQNNINTDPHFVNAAGRDYRLLPFSPCIDAGDFLGVELPATDLQGLPRRANVPEWYPDVDSLGLPPTDLGCYEVADFTDCNSNGVWDVSDILIGADVDDCNNNGVIDACEGQRFPLLLPLNSTGIQAQWIGPPDDTYAGIGGQTLTFDFGAGRILNGDGPDFTIYEVDFGAVEFNRLADVLASTDGLTFWSVKFTETTPVHTPGDERHSSPLFARSYDIAAAGRSIRCIRLVGSGADPAGGNSGFDLDAVGAVYYAGSEPFDAVVSQNSTGFPNDNFTGRPNAQSVGLGGQSVTFDLGNIRATDGPGADFNVYESAIDADEANLIDVLVSVDGQTWRSVAATAGPLVPIPTAGASAGGGNGYDLAGSSLSAIRYIRIDGVGDAPASPTGGYDLDAIGLVFPAPLTCRYCLPDVNHDGLLNSQDFFSFLTSFFAGAADFNHDNFTNSQDFFDFLNAFFAGC